MHCSMEPRWSDTRNKGFPWCVYSFEALCFMVSRA